MNTATRKSLAVAASLAAGIASAGALTMEMVTVGNAGNAADPLTGYGSVAYDYQIGKYEVTIGQYTEFLNAVAATDTYGLYNAYMGTNLEVTGITQAGNSGSYTYAARGSANNPITYVSWFDAARFSNWMQNGQGAGSTETGAYTLIDGQTTGIITKNAGATWYIPSEDEWYKAAYYQPESMGGDTDGYWFYPTRSNDVPGNTIGNGTNQANYRRTNYSTGSAPYLTDVDAYTGSASFYGTFDQGGNVSEWNDAVIEGSSRGLRGGSWLGIGSPDALQSSFRGSFFPEFVSSDIGFRMAGIPEPSTVAFLLLSGAAVLAFKRRRSRQDG